MSFRDWLVAMEGGNAFLVGEHLIDGEWIGAAVFFLVCVALACWVAVLDQREVSV